MEDIRNQLIEQISPLLSEMIGKANQGRFNGDMETYKLRVSYVNALSNLLRAFNQLLRDKEYEELLEEVNALKEQMRSKE